MNRHLGISNTYPPQPTHTCFRDSFRFASCILRSNMSFMWWPLTTSYYPLNSSGNLINSSNSCVCHPPETYTVLPWSFNRKEGEWGVAREGGQYITIIISIGVYCMDKITVDPSPWLPNCTCHFFSCPVLDCAFIYFLAQSSTGSYLWCSLV